MPDRHKVGKDHDPVTSRREMCFAPRDLVWPAYYKFSFLSFGSASKSLVIKKHFHIISRVFRISESFKNQHLKISSNEEDSLSPIATRRFLGFASSIVARFEMNMIWGFFFI